VLGGVEPPRAAMPPCRHGWWGSNAIQLARVLEMIEFSPDRFVYENRIAERFGGQKELDWVSPLRQVSPRQKHLILINSFCLKRRTLHPNSSTGVGEML
jgi:hypothetical protein